MENKHWLDQILDELLWTPADLSRATNLDSAVISNIRNGRREIGIDTAVAISKATNIPPETILRKAGKLPPGPEINEDIEKMVYEAAKLSKSDQAEVLAFIRMKNNLRKK